ncbi:MAG: Ig-like domain-containing protein [Clostridia bacterium]|nr:Ig-like domain-containing protein [Clostridia bacterium]
MHRIRIFSALVLLSLVCTVLPAAAEPGDAYRSLLAGEKSGRIYFALTDLDGDLNPELVEIRYNSDRSARIQVFTPGGAGAVQLGGTVSVQGFKGITMKKRADAGKNAALVMTIKSAAGGVSSVRKTTWTGSGVESDLDARTKGGTKTYYSGARSMTAAQYSVAWKQVTARYSRSLGSVAFVAYPAPLSGTALNDRISQAAAAFRKRETITKIRFRKSKVVMKAGKTLKLTTKTIPSNAIHDSLTWTSDKPEVATVAGGAVTAVAYGTATVRAQSRYGRSAEIKILVKSAAPVLNHTSVKVARGDTVQLTANVPVSWVSANKAVATVNQSGVVTGIAAGQKTTVSAVTPDGVKSSCTVTVTKATRQPVILDISEYNTVTDWPKLAQNVDLVIVRCGITKKSPGNKAFQDSKFVTNAKMLNKYGIPFGVYYYGRANTASFAAMEAKACYSYASSYNPRFYVYDAEESAINKASIEAFVAAMRQLGADRVGLYIAHNLYAKYGVNPKAADFIWIPRYGSNSGKPETAPLYPCDLWQYTSKGTIPGVSGRVDLSKLNGKKDLYDLIG